MDHGSPNSQGRALWAEREHLFLVVVQPSTPPATTDDRGEPDD